MLSLESSGRNAASHTGAWATAFTFFTCCTAIAAAASSSHQTGIAYRGDSYPLHNGTVREWRRDQAFPQPLFTDDQSFRAVGPDHWASTGNGPSPTVMAAMYRRFEAAVNAALEMAASLSLRISANAWQPLPQILAPYPGRSAESQDQHVHSAHSRHLLNQHHKASIHFTISTASRDLSRHSANPSTDTTGPDLNTDPNPKIGEGSGDAGVGPEGRGAAIREWLDRQGDNLDKGLIRLTGPPILSNPREEPSAGVACGEALQIPKVAVLFLTKGELFHEPTWWLWFKYAAGLVPATAIMKDAEECRAADGQGPGCLPSASKRDIARRLCKPEAGAGVLQNQHLFSVYVHALPDYGEFPHHSIFHRREIRKRIQAEWGTHQLAEAARNLMQEALQDPLNQRFILLSESGIPLYPPHTVYLQLMGEKLSRINACSKERNNYDDRFTDKMGDQIGAAWRKSSQWIGLTRRHAQLVVADNEVFPIFEEHCTSGWDDHLDKQRDCVSDEHYIPTLLAYKGLENETDCMGCLVSTRWNAKKGKTTHPYSYKPSEIIPSRLKLLRERPDWVGQDDPECDWAAAIESSTKALVRAADLDSSSKTGSLPMYNKPLPGYCTLFARKFPKESVNQVFNLLRSCRTGLNITQGDCTD